MTHTLDESGTDRRVYSNQIRAGQRTYFFDVKVNRNNHYYLVITESKKRFDPSGKSGFDKYKIHLYHESVVAFSNMLKEMEHYLVTNNPQQIVEEKEQLGQSL